MFYGGALALIIEVLPNIFMVKVPLPWPSPGAVNSYIIRAKKPLVIDTGFNAEICYAALLGAMNKIGVDYREADYFITHFHVDHIGLVGKLTKNIYIGDEDAKILQDDFFKPNILKFFIMNGFSQRDLEAIMRFRSSVNLKGVNFQPVKDGEILEYGDYMLRAISTPGHTPGHMCLYDEKRRILFSGDHILFNITPSIFYWKDHDSLSEYLNSLEKIYYLNANRAFPGHGDFHEGVNERILELKRHHNKRLEEIIGALRGGAKTAWQLASHITWNISYNEWSELSPIQKWFIINEVVTHLLHLERRGVITKEIRHGIFYYELR